MAERHSSRALVSVDSAAGTVWRALRVHGRPASLRELGLHHHATWTTAAGKLVRSGYLRRVGKRDGSTIYEALEGPGSVQDGELGRRKIAMHEARQEITMLLLAIRGGRESPEELMERCQKVRLTLQAS